MGKHILHSAFCILHYISLAYAADDLSADRACLSQCHGQFEREVTLRGRSASYVDVAQLRSSVHQQLACLDCHRDITKVPHGEDIAPVKCVNCHYKGNPRRAPGGEEYRDYIESVHAQMGQDGEKRPGCTDCHGVHGILSPQDAQSPTHKAHVPETCGKCHTEIFEEYATSVHGKALLWDGILESPNCADCHGVHRILSPKDVQSPVHPTHVSQTCATCHQAVEIVGKYGIATERVSTYQQSFHGLANKYGVKAVANCATCHGVHNILPSSEPTSTIHPSNIRQTCGQEGCHPDAIEAFSRGPVHLGAVNPPPVVNWVRVGYTALIIIVIGGMVLHNILDYINTHRRRRHGGA